MSFKYLRPFLTWRDLLSACSSCPAPGPAPRQHHTCSLQTVASDPLPSSLAHLRQQPYFAPLFICDIKSIHISLPYLRWFPLVGGVHFPGGLWIPEVWLFMTNPPTEGPQKTHDARRGVPHG